MLPAGIVHMAGCGLVAVLVGPRGRVGLVTPTPNGHLPALSLFGAPQPPGQPGPLEVGGLSESGVMGHLTENGCAWPLDGRWPASRIPVLVVCKYI
jgi:hypothetical protein